MNPEIGFQGIPEEFSLVSAAFQSAFLWHPDARMAGNPTETSDSSQFQTSGNALPTNFPALQIRSERLETLREPVIPAPELTGVRK